MKLFISILILLFAQQALAQKSDTIWYNNKWEKTQEVSARHYCRVVQKLGKDNYSVKDFYETGAKQMEGFYSSIEPEIKNGEFKYWYRSGNKQMDVTYEANKETQVCQYNEQGEITNEWELIAKISLENGKPVTEYLVLQRSPKFPGGKEAMNKFIIEHIKYPDNNLGISGKVVIQFKVDVDGKIIDPAIVTSLSPANDRAAINLIKKMPNWEPGKQDGKFVPITFSLPIVFN